MARSQVGQVRSPRAQQLVNRANRDRVLVVVVAGVLAMTGCTAITSTPTAAPATTAGSISPVPSASPSGSSTSTTASPTAVPTVTVSDLPPMKPSKAEQVVNDPSLIDFHRGAAPDGPATFSVDGNNVVVDNELPEHPLLVAYRNGRKIRTVRSPKDCCIDLRVEGDRYWTLGDYATEWLLKKDANRLTKVKGITLPPETETSSTGEDSPNPVHWDFGRLERTDTGLFAVPSDGPAVLLEGTGTVPDAPPMHREGKTVVIEDPGFTAKIRTRAKDAEDAEAGFLSRYGDYVYYEVTDGVGPNWGYIYQFTTTGTLVNTYTLHQGFIQTGNRIIVITDDGQVYQLVITTKTARILRLTPNETASR